MLYIKNLTKAHPLSIAIPHITKKDNSQKNTGIVSKLYYFFLLSCAGTSYRCMRHCLTLKVNMERITAQITNVIETVSKLGIGLIALGIAEIIFGQGAIFGASVVSNVSIVASIGEDDYMGLSPSY